MRRSYFHHPIYLLFLAELFISSCNGQVGANNPKKGTSDSKPGSVVIETPPFLFSYSEPSSDSDLVGQYIRSIFQDSKGNYWFGTAGQSVARFDGKTLKYYSKKEFFLGNDSVDNDYGNSVHAIAEDKNGNIWFGTEHGAIKYDGKTFRSYTQKNGLSNIYVGRKSILIDKAGTLWVGTNSGVFRYIPSADTTEGKCFSLFQLLPPIKVKDIMEDKSGNIWFASEDNGVFRYDPSVHYLATSTERESAGRRKAIINISEKKGLGDNYAGGMVQDQACNFWFTMKGGICRYDARMLDQATDRGVGPDGQGKVLPSGQTGFTEFTTKDGLGGSEVWGIYIEKSGIIWITTRGSTTRYDPSISNSKAFTVFTDKDGINCCVQSMYQDRSGNMWWGTGAGLYRFDGKRFYQVKQQGPWE